MVVPESSHDRSCSKVSPKMSRQPSLFLSLPFQWEQEGHWYMHCLRIPVWCPRSSVWLCSHWWCGVLGWSIMSSYCCMFISQSLLVRMFRTIRATDSPITVTANPDSPFVVWEHVFSLGCSPSPCLNLCLIIYWDCIGSKHLIGIAWKDDQKILIS